MALDCIMECYQAGTLADESDIVLHQAQVTVAVWHDWRIHHPNDKTRAVPSIDLLKRVYDFLESLVNRRYGCND